MDTDSGGAPDYLENFSGDGHTNNVGEGNWQNGSDDVNYLVQPGYLRCEYRVDPWGVDAKDPVTGLQKPRLFWYSLLLDYRFPSWLHQITNSGAIYSAARTNYGATTSWERWDGLVSRAGGGYNSGYNSFNHFWAGAVGEWIYRNIAGINPDDSAPGFQNVVIKPQPGGGITNALGSFRSIHGQITCSWTNDTATTNFSLNITVPANATASVYILGATNLGSIAEGGAQATNAPGLLHPPIVANGAALFQVGSGSYQFRAPVRF